MYADRIGDIVILLLRVGLRTAAAGGGEAGTALRRALSLCGKAAQQYDEDQKCPLDIHPAIFVKKTEVLLKAVGRLIKIRRPTDNNQ